MKFITNIFDFIRRGSANGVASLDSSGKVPLSELPLDPDIYIVVPILSSVNDPVTNKIYLVPSDDSKEGNNFNEYIWVDNNWELVGSLSADINLDDYYNKSEIDTKLDNLDMGDGGSSVNVVDNLTSTSTTDALSANQGRVLEDRKLDNIVEYGTCSTAVGTLAKTVTLAGFVRRRGARISVLFSNGNNNTGAVTLNVNGTGASQIRLAGKAVNGFTGITAAEALSIIPAGAVLDLVWNGTAWELLNLKQILTTTEARAEVISAYHSNITIFYPE